MNVERPQDELRASPIVIVGIVGSVLVFVIIVLLTALFLWIEEAEIAEKTAGQAPSELRRSENEQLMILNDYGWVDQEKGLVRIPIDRAIELMLAEAVEKEEGR